MTREEAAVQIAKMYLSAKDAVVLDESCREAVLLAVSVLLYEPVRGQLDLAKILKKEGYGHEA